MKCSQREVEFAIEIATAEDQGTDFVSRFLRAWRFAKEASNGANGSRKWANETVIKMINSLVTNNTYELSSYRSPTKGTLENITHNMLGLIEETSNGYWEPNEWRRWFMKTKPFESGNRETAAIVWNIMAGNKSNPILPSQYI